MHIWLTIVFSILAIYFLIKVIKADCFEGYLFYYILYLIPASITVYRISHTPNFLNSINTFVTNIFPTLSKIIAY